MKFSELGLPSDYPDFVEYGAPPCSESDPDSFFSLESLESSMRRQPAYPYEREAKMICSSCPYQMRCLEYAIKHPEEQGIWGGTTEYERRRIRSRGFSGIRIPPSRHR